MIRSFLRWMRVVLPPGWVIAIALALYLVLEVYYGWWEWWVGIPGAGQEFLRLRDGLAGMSCAAYGVFRVWAFHPLLRPAYRQWLELTPWTSRKPLPLGPIHLVVQDIVVLAIVLLLMHDSQIRFVLVPAAFLGPYLVVLCCSLLLADTWIVGYALAFGLGLAVRLAVYPGVSLWVLAALYLLSYFGLRRSLARFPWQRPEWLEGLFARTKSNRAESAKPQLGWPYDRLQFKLPDRIIPRKHVILPSLLAGWYLYALASIVPDTAAMGHPGMLFPGALLACVFGRLGTYCSFHWPPISVWGRIWTFRWIIPGHDQVLVAPLCTLMVAIMAPVATVSLGVPWEFAFPISLTLMLLITLGLGPRLRHWRLTGNHRITAAGLKRTEFDQL